MARIYNFSAGPAILPEPVLKQAQQDLWEFGESGLGIAECSHRSKLFDAVAVSARTRVARLLGVSLDEYAVLFLQGGARGQFFQFPMNMLQGGRATYLDTGRWDDMAAKDAARYGDVDVAWSSQETGWNRVPNDDDYVVQNDTRYLHYTSNNTVAGGEFRHTPDAKGAWLVCDMSSNFLSHPVDGTKFDFIYAGAQKNVGPSGVTICVIRRSLLDRVASDVPDVLRYDKQVAKDGMVNTPCTFGIYVIEQVCRWLEDDMGGLSGIEARNIAQANKVYAQIDGTDFWQGKVETSARSRMNITFTTGNPELDTAFVKAADEARLSGLKGHRSVGGLRASLYNAQTDEAVDALVAFMAEFERTNG
ncbi:MAG: 3-phosphoserine/phosphohydroxythreonine transaminase [Myxococcota bacterium]